MKKKTSINNHSYLNLYGYRRTLTLYSIIQSELHHVRQTTRYIQSPTRRRTQKPCLPLGSSSGRIHVAGLGRRFGLGFLLGFPFLVKLNPIGSIIFLQNKLKEVCLYILKRPSENTFRRPLLITRLSSNHFADIRIGMHLMNNLINLIQVLDFNCEFKFHKAFRSRLRFGRRIDRFDVRTRVGNRLRH